MTTSIQRLYLIQVANMTFDGMTVPIPCYLVQAQDGKNILIDSGLPLASAAPPEARQRQVSVEHTGTIIEQLALLDLKPSDIDIFIATHLDIDHSGNNATFSNARHVVQRLQHDVASAGHPRFAYTRSQWDQPAASYQLLDGDTELLPGLDLIETSGHVPGHQAVLITLPKTGVVLLAIDAVAHHSHYRADRQGSPVDADAEGAIASTRKLLAIAENVHPALVVFGHDRQQWETLKKLPEYYD